MKHLFVIYSMLFTFVGMAQTTIKETITIPAGEEKSYEIAGADGDAIEMQFERESGSKLDLEVLIYPRRKFFTEKDFKELRRIITVTVRGVYVIKLQNTSSKASTFKVNIVSSNYTGIPVTLDYQIKRDTTYAYKVSQKRLVEKLETTAIQNDKFYLNSRSNAFVKGGKNRVVIPVQLPENTQEWYYVFTASRTDEGVQNTLKTFNLAAALTTFIDKDKDLKSSVGSLAAPPGADICDVYVLDEANARLFTEKEDFTYQMNASRENYKSGIVRVADTKNKTVYIGLQNADNLHGLHVAVEVVAIVKSSEEIQETVNIPVIISQKIPVVVDL